MGKLGYHTSFLKNLLLRIEKAAKGTVRFIDEDDKTRLDVAVIFSFDFSTYFSHNLSQTLNESERRQWFTIAEDRSHSRNRRYMSILNYIIDGAMALAVPLSIPTVLGFTFSSIEELDMKLSINGY